MLVVPRQYTSLVNSQTTANIDRLSQSLDGTDTDSAKELIYNFCIENRTYALLQTGAEALVFGDKDSIDGSDESFTVSTSLNLSDKNDISVLTVVASTSATNEVKSTLLTLIPAILGLILCISGFCAWLCSRNIVRPVLEICSVSERMAQLDMTWHCDASRRDELGVLANNLNSLSERLTFAMAELETANEQLKKDVEASRNMEKQRRDFFSAASHELKTPVTVLKGQLESMELGIGDYKNHEKYLPQAIQAVENIEALIKEMLAISKMESGIPSQAFSQESLAEIINCCVEQIKPLAKEKNIEIICKSADDIVLRVYLPMFRKAVTNILLNAVEYSPEGEQVCITITEDVLTVTNSGVTIPDEDIPSLFTPFYRAEKSRNRKSGGSGLGLYIVKTILDLHGFVCKIGNDSGCVVFTVMLNQN